ncbi:toxin-antitoxin system YwqK family antitoxin [Labilibaculum sp.]|uniref:toxin-antitoxin system YwqK family antitoxin n=1 Tax=Labilibaculum sp. TaxID=2060723 RepID=UPI003568DE33
MKNSLILISVLFVFSSCDFFHKKAKEEVAGKEDKVVNTSNSKGKNGTEKYYFGTGELKSIVHYKDNKKVGISETFYQSGEKQYDIPYVDGMKQGAVKWYYKDGKVYRETTYFKGKKDGIQKKFWENGHLKSELYYEKDMLSRDLKEYTKSGKEKTVPSIKVEKIDLLKSSEEYVLRFRLSNGRKNVQFYQGNLIEGKFFPSKGTKGFVVLKTVGGVGELRVRVPKGFNVNKKIPIVAVEKTAYQNDRLLSTVVPLVIQN